MSQVELHAPEHGGHAGPVVREIDDKRGTFAVALLIATEATIFLMLFISYYYLEKGGQRWKVEEPPKLHYALPMLAILLASSVVLHWGEKQVKKKKYRGGRLGLIGTLALGIAFLVMTYFEYAEGLLHVTPRTDAYGSIFYTIITLHAAHVMLGILMLLWVFFIPRWEPAQRMPHRPYHNVGLYWHFVDTVWIFVVAILYVGPNIYNAL